jgi:hypothetical protein
MSCGTIPRGPVQRPTGSGHWLLVYGHTHLVVNDPWGEPDLVSGATLNARVSLVYIVMAEVSTRIFRENCDSRLDSRG